MTFLALVNPNNQESTDTSQSSCPSASTRPGGAATAPTFRLPTTCHPLPQRLPRSEPPEVIPPRLPWIEGNNGSDHAHAARGLSRQASDVKRALCTTLLSVDVLKQALADLPRRRPPALPAPVGRG